MHTKAPCCFFLVENSSLLAKSAFLRDVMQYLSAALPWFVVDYVKQDLQAVFPHSRSRGVVAWASSRLLQREHNPSTRAGSVEVGRLSQAQLEVLVDARRWQQRSRFAVCKAAGTICQRYKGLVKQDLLDGHGFEIAVLELEQSTWQHVRSSIFSGCLPGFAKLRW